MSLSCRVARLVLIAVSLAGCTSDDYLRANGLTPWAGDALAANTAMQMVDPWPAGVQNRDLRVPAARVEPAQTPGGSDYGAGGAATDTGGGKG